MIRAVPILVTLAGLQTLIVFTPAQCADQAIPAAVRQLGLTVHTFSTTRFSPSNVDDRGSYVSGKQWYLTNFFGGRTPTTAIHLSNDGVMSVSNPDDSSNDTVATIAVAPKPGKFVGTAFGCGGYFVAKLALDLDGFDRSFQRGFPAFWTMSAEHLVGLDEHWLGQANDYSHFIEADIFEFDRPQSDQANYGFTLHDWFGIYNKTCKQQSFCSLSSSFNQGTIVVPDSNVWAEYHEYGMLWLPAASSRKGFVQAFFDGVPHGQAIDWSEFRPMEHPAPLDASNPYTFGIIDRQHLALIIGSGSGKVKVKSVDVWQSSSACNISG